MLENVYGLFFIIFFAFLFPLRGSFITVELLSRIACICMISPLTKFLLRFAMGGLHVSLTSRPVYLNSKSSTGESDKT